MKKFMFIFRGPDYDEVNFSPEQSQAYMQKWFDWIGQLSQQGAYVSGEQLMKTGKLLTGSKKPVTDGPFTEGKELVGGYFIVKAESLESATEMAKGFPDFELQGTVEIREVIDHGGQA